jgi:hypothetical protein
MTCVTMNLHMNGFDRIDTEFIVIPVPKEQTISNKLYAYIWFYFFKLKKVN